MDNIQWIPKRMVELAYDKGVINGWDIKFYNNVWGKTRLSQKQSKNKARIDQMILNAQKKGLLAHSEIISRHQLSEVSFPHNWDATATHVKYGNTYLTISMLKRGYAQHQYRIRLDRGLWPSDDNLFTLCDGNVPPNRRHFGGLVESVDDNHRIVTVYTD